MEKRKKRMKRKKDVYKRQVWNGKCLTARILESPNPESGCILSDILIEDVPEKYYLSQQQMERLLFKSRQADRGNESTKPKG